MSHFQNESNFISKFFIKIKFISGVSVTIWVIVTIFEFEGFCIEDFDSGIILVQF